MNPEQWLSLKWNGGSTMSDRWLNQSKIIQKAQELRISRNLKRAKVSTESNRVIIRRQYAFSYMLQCYFCGSNLSRRTWHSSSKYSKVIWQCVKSAKKGRDIKKCFIKRL